MEICRYGITDIYDLRLIGDAARLHYSDWGAISDYKRMAHQNGTQRILDRIESILYHREEWSAGML